MMIRFCSIKIACDKAKNGPECTELGIVNNIGTIGS
jgi:hypothetical protein